MGNLDPTKILEAVEHIARAIKDNDLNETVAQAAMKALILEQEKRGIRAEIKVRNLRRDLN